MTTKKTEEEIRILKKSTCPSLSGRSELTYEFGHNDKSKSIKFRISENTGAGHFCDHWIPLDDILKYLQKAKGAFSLSTFREIYAGQSINNTGFLGAVLQHEELIVCEKRRYLRKGNPKTFVADINKLIKPTKKASKQKTAKA